ncbi:anti-sigma F factor antagonist [Desulfofalx alkaliphila]|uniref:anti-sigma F factor antagonist n=1 Tax=Desulfofalx alkaliphila TaxID=105483 RepID=UPI0004E1E7FD|nr:anti-sigma F factor antagonist [Desulfofalx alkaliphila]
MYWKHELEENTLFVRLSGEFDIAVADKLRADLDNILDQSQVRHMIFNLADVNYIDSSGLGVILGRYKRLNKQGGKVAFVSPQPQVRRVLELSGLLTIISEYSDEDEALRKIG